MLKIGFDAKRLFHNTTGLGNYSRSLVRGLKEFHPENNYILFSPSISYNEESYYFTKNFELVTDYICRNAESGDLVITLGCGDVYKAAKSILKKLEEK